MGEINSTIYFTILSGIYLAIVSVMLFVKKRKSYNNL